jgi:hypothetical protein
LPRCSRRCAAKTSRSASFLTRSMRLTIAAIASRANFMLRRSSAFSPRSRRFTSAMEVPGAYVDLEGSSPGFRGQVGTCRPATDQSLHGLHELALDLARCGTFNSFMHVLWPCMPQVASHLSPAKRQRFAGRDILQCDSLSHVHLIPLSSRRFGFPGSGATNRPHVSHRSRRRGTPDTPQGFGRRNSARDSSSARYLPVRGTEPALPLNAESTCRGSRTKYVSPA